MNANRLFDAKKGLREVLGNEYPTSREGLTFAFLTEFGSYVPGVDEDDYEDYGEYEDAKYSSVTALDAAIPQLRSGSWSARKVWGHFIMKSNKSCKKSLSSYVILAIILLINWLKHWFFLPM